MPVHPHPLLYYNEGTGQGRRAEGRKLDEAAGGAGTQLPFSSWECLLVRGAESGLNRGPPFPGAPRPVHPRPPSPTGGAVCPGVGPAPGRTPWFTGGFAPFPRGVRLRTGSCTPEPPARPLRVNRVAVLSPDSFRGLSAAMGAPEPPQRPLQKEVPVRTEPVPGAAAGEGCQAEFCFLTSS